MTASKNPNVAAAKARRREGMNSSVGLGTHLAGMKSGDEVSVGHPATGKSVSVRYEAEQAMGDNGQPAKGYTVGHYHVNGPGEDQHESFRHSPHGPTLMGAKPYAAGMAAQRINALFQDRRGGEPGLTAL